MEQRCQDSDIFFLREPKNSMRGTISYYFIVLYISFLLKIGMEQCPTSIPLERKCKDIIYSTPRIHTKSHAMAFNHSAEEVETDEVLGHTGQPPYLNYRILGKNENFCFQRQIRCT